MIKKNFSQKYNKKSYKKVIETTGISKVFHVGANEDIVSLATKASKVLNNKKNIDAIILVTQTP